MLKRPKFAFNSARSLMARDAGSFYVSVWALEEEEVEEPLVRIPIAGVGLSALLFRSDDELVSLSRDGYLVCWRISSDGDKWGFEELWRHVYRTTITTALVIRRAEDPCDLFVAGDEKGFLMLIDVSTDKPMATVGHGHSDAIVEIAVSHQGSRIASSSRDLSVCLWPVRGEVLHPVEGSAEVSAQDVLDFFALDDPSDVQQIESADVTTEDVLQFFSVASDARGSTQLPSEAEAEGDAAPDGRSSTEVVTDHERQGADDASEGTDDEQVADDASEVAADVSEVPGDEQVADDVSEVTDDGQRVADNVSEVADDVPKEANVRDVPVFDDPQVVPNVLTPEKRLRGAEGWLISLAFSNSGEYLAAGGIDNGVYVWRLEGDLQPAAVQYSHFGWVVDVEWSPDDAVIASASWDTTIGLFDAPELTPILCFEGHQDYVADLVFMAEERLVSAGYDNRIRIWDWKNPALVQTLAVHTDWVEAVRRLDDGFVSLSSDGTMRTWSGSFEATGSLGKPAGAGIEIGDPVIFSEYVDTTQLASYRTEGDLKEEPSAVRYRDHRSSGFSASSGKTAMSLLEGALDIPAEELDLPDVQVERDGISSFPLGVSEAGIQSKEEQQSTRTDDDQQSGNIDESELEPELESELEPEPGLEPELASEPELEPEPESKLASAPELEPEPESKLASEPELELASEPELEPELELASKPEFEPELELASTPELEPELELASKPELEPELELASTPELEPTTLIGPFVEDVSDDEPELKLDFYDDSRGDRGIEERKRSTGSTMMGVGADDRLVRDGPIPEDVLDALIDSEAGLDEISNTSEKESSSASVAARADVSPDKKAEDERKPVAKRSRAVTKPGSVASHILSGKAEKRKIPTAGIPAPGERSDEFGRSRTDKSKPILDGAPSEAESMGDTSPVDDAEKGPSAVSTGAIEDMERLARELRKPIEQSNERVDEIEVDQLWTARPSQTLAAPQMGIMRRRKKGDDITFEKLTEIRTPHDWVYGVAISHDGKQIASCGGDRSICVWNQRGDQLHRFRLKAKGHNDVVFSPDGQMLAAGGDDGKIHVWLLSDRASKHALLGGHSSWVTSLSFSADSRFLLSSSYDGTSRLWSLEKGKCGAILEGHEGPVAAASMSVSRAVSVGHDGTARVWNSKWIQMDHFDGYDQLLDCTTIGAISAWSAANGEVFLLQKDQPEALLRHRGQARSVHLRDDGTLASGGEDGEILIYGRGKTEPHQSLSLGAPAWSVETHGQLLVCGADDGQLHVFKQKGT